MRVPPSRSVRVCAVLALAGFAVTCRDDPTGPGAGRRAALAVQPVLPANLNLAAFGISVDSVRVIIIRPLTDTIADRRVAFPADSSELQLPLSVQLQQQVETLTVVLEYRGGGFLLFTGTQTMGVRAGPPGTNPPTPIAMTFVGPGAGVDSLLVEPLDSVVSWGDSLRFRVLAFQGGAPVSNFYVSWTTSDTLTARVNAFGVVRAPSQRDTVFVKATTPSTAADSVLVAFMPQPSALTVISGINQTGLPGSVLPQPLRVRAIAPDALGVPQVAVRFAATVGGGSVVDSVVITDDSGFAQTTATLGAALGPNSFTATATGLPVASFQATAIAGVGTAHSADIATSETWAAAGNPHVVTGYLRVRNGATLTIEPGAEVRFDADAGLQVGDTTSGEVGTLLMDGSATPITLTANTGTPTPGFWKGIELQRAGAATWNRVLFEWGGSARAPMAPQPESCLLSVNAQGATVTLDSVRFRQCVHAGIHHFGGTLVITRSVFDSATGSGIHADFQAVLTVDSSLFRGSGNEGLQILNPGVQLVSATGNTFLGQGARAISIFGAQLHGLRRQAAIAGNGNDSIYVQAGRVDTSVAAFTIEAQPVPYLVDGLVEVGRAGAGGATVTLDSGLVMAFTSLGGLQVGDTSGTQRGQIRTRSTAANPAVLRNRAGGTPWRGVGLGLSAAADTLRHVRLVLGGGGGGVFGAASDANLTIYKPSGADPFFVDSLVSDSSFSDGLHIASAPAATPPSRVVRSAFNGNTGHGLVILTAGTTPAVLDSLNRFGFNDGWPVVLSGHALGGHTAQAAFDTTGPGPNEIRVVSGQTFTVSMQPPAQLPYRMDDSVRLVQGGGGGGTFTLEPNLVLKFGHGAGLIIGDSASGPAGSIASLGTGPADAPRLTSRFGSPAPGDWYGLEIGRLSGNTRLANVRIEYAGDSIAGRDQPRFGLWVRNAQPATFTLDSAVLVRNGALDVSGRMIGGLIVTAAGSGVDIRRSRVDSTLGGAGMGALVPGVRFTDDSARGNDRTGLAVILPAGIQVPSNDSIAGNVLTANGGYPLEVSPGALQALHLQALLSGNARDTIAVRDSGYITDSTRLRRYPGVPYFFDRRVIVDSGATLTIDAGDTLGFSNIAGLDIGTPANPAVLRVEGTSFLPVLMTRPIFPNAFWRGIHFRNVAPSGSFPEIRGLIVERAGFIGTCTGDCQPPLFGAIHWTSASGENVTFDSITVRHPLTHAVNVVAASAGTVVITNSQFYDTLSFRSGPPVFKSPRGNGLNVSLSDIYRYGATAVEAVFQGIDSVNVENNYWGDGAGLTTLFAFSDSLGRASTGQTAVNFEPFATTPHFPVGAAARMVSVQDTAVGFGALVGDTIGDPDSLRVRVLDAEGRGVNGVGVAWSQSHAGLMLPDPGATANGGRHGARWKLDVLATQQLAFATGVGPGVTFSVDPQPDSTVSTAWRIIQAGPGGIIATDSLSVSYTSSNRPTVLVTRTFDQYGNVTQPSSGFFFTDVPSNTGFQQYGVIDSVVQDSLVYFRPTSAVPGAYQLHALYDSGLFQDSILITVTPSAAGVRVDQDGFSPGVQDSVVLAMTSICPPAGPCVITVSEQALVAEVVDSGGAPLGNAGAQFGWTRVGGAALTDSTTGAVADTFWIQARANGVDTIIVEDIQSGSPTFGKRDTVPVLVHQLGVLLQITPPADTLLVGQQATYQAEVQDAAFQPLGNDTIHFVVTPFEPGALTITDSSLLNQVTVQLDTTPYGTTFLTAKWGRPLADTAFGYFPGDTLVGVAIVVNPVVTPFATSVTPYAIAANPVTNRVYVSHEGSDLVTVIDGTSDAVITNINALPTKYIAVNSATNRVYVTSATGNDLRIIDGATNSVVGFLPLGAVAGGMAVDEARSLVYVPAEVSGAPKLLVVADDTSGSPSVVTSVALPNTGIEAAYNASTGLIYVTTSDGVTGPDAVIVINAATRTVVDTIAVDDGARGVAVHSGLNRVFVANAVDQTVSIIDAAMGTVVFAPSIPFTLDRISVDQAASVVYVIGTNASEVWVLDAATGFFLGSIPLPDVSTDARVNPATGRVYVTQPGQDGVSILRY